MVHESAVCVECDHPAHGMQRCGTIDYGRYDPDTGEYLDPAPLCDCTEDH